MSYLANASFAKERRGALTRIEEGVLEANDLLEAFGNGVPPSGSPSRPGWRRCRSRSAGCRDGG